MKKRAREKERDKTKSPNTKRKPTLYEHNTKRLLKVEEGEIIW